MASFVVLFLFASVQSASISEKCLISNSLGLMDCSNLDLESFEREERVFPDVKIRDLSSNNIVDPEIPLPSFPNLQVINLNGNKNLKCSSIHRLPPRIKIHSACAAPERTCRNSSCGPTEECKLTGNGDPVCVFKGHQKPDPVADNADSAGHEKAIYSAVGSALGVLFLCIVVYCLWKCQKRGLAARAHYDSRKGTITADMIVLAEQETKPHELTSHVEELMNVTAVSFPPPPPPPGLAFAQH